MAAIMPRLSGDRGAEEGEQFFFTRVRVLFAERDERLHERRLEEEIARERAAPAALERAEGAEGAPHRLRQQLRVLRGERVERLRRLDREHFDAAIRQH